MSTYLEATTTVTLVVGVGNGLALVEMDGFGDAVSLEVHVVAELDCRGCCEAYGGEDAEEDEGLDVHGRYAWCCWVL